jgi:preprotein translocase subunit SecY
MADNRDKAPTAQETFMQMAQATGLRDRLLITVGLLVLIRVGIYIPVPGIDRIAFANSISQNGALSFLDLFSGGGLKSLGIFALGIIPYINASIILQLLTAAKICKRMKARLVAAKSPKSPAMWPGAGP